MCLNYSHYHFFNLIYFKTQAKKNLFRFYIDKLINSFSFNNAKLYLIKILNIFFKQKLKIITTFFKKYFINMLITKLSLA